MTEKKRTSSRTARPKRKPSATSKEKASIQSPHDGLFKTFMNIKQVSASFLKEYVSPKIVEQLDLNTLKIVKDSFIDKKMSRYYADILYQVRYGNRPLFLYFLFEHKSTGDWFICLQLLKYMIRIWELYLNQNKKAKYLPVIIPLVIYQGHKKWDIDSHFATLFEETHEIEQYIPNFTYDLLDISHLNDEEIKGDVLLRILLMTMKYVFDPSLEDKMGNIFKLFDDVMDRSRGIEILDVVLRYFTATTDIPSNKIHESVAQFTKEGGDLMMTLEKRLKDEGKTETQWSVLKKALRKGLSIDDIADLLSTTTNQVRKMIAKIDGKTQSSSAHPATT